MRKFKENFGYTLIEMIAVIFVVIIVGSIITAIIVSALRGSNRSQSVNDVRQAGNIVLTQLAKSITYANGFEGLAVKNDIDNNGILNVNKTCQNSSKTYNYLKIIDFNNLETTYICGVGNKIYTSNATGWKQADIENAKASLLESADAPANKGFTVDSCSITCNQSNLAISPTITINFTLTKATNSLFVENKISKVPFETTVTVRNYLSQP